MRATDTGSLPGIRSYNLPIIRTLVTKGADILYKTAEGYDTFSYCHSVRQTIFLASCRKSKHIPFLESLTFIDNQLRRFKLIICPACTYVHFPVTDDGKSLQTAQVTGKLPTECDNCKKSLEGVGKHLDKLYYTYITGRT
jgi:hypothetical protein